MMRIFKSPTFVCLILATSVAWNGCSDSEDAHHDQHQTAGDARTTTHESGAASASAAREAASVSSESSVTKDTGANSTDSGSGNASAGGGEQSGVETTPVVTGEAPPARQLEPVEICSLPEGAPIALTRLDGNRLGYGCSVPIPPLGFFEKFYCIDLETNRIEEIEREQFFTLTTPDRKVAIRWEESFGFRYVADGDRLRKVEFSSSKIMCRDVSEDWHEIASFAEKVESVALAPDGTAVLVSIDGEIHCVRPSGERRVALSAEGIHYKQPAFGSAGDTFYVKSVPAQAGDVAVLACDLKSGQSSIVLRVENLLGFSISPDGAFLAYLESAVPTKRIRILALAEKKLVAEIEHEQSNVLSNPLLAFSHDSSAICFGMHDAEGVTLFRAVVR